MKSKEKNYKSNKRYFRLILENSIFRLFDGYGCIEKSKMNFVLENEFQPILE